MILTGLRHSRALTWPVALIYFCLTCSSTFAVFHRHQVTVDADSIKPHAANHELHESGCEEHVTAGFDYNHHCVICKTSTERLLLAFISWIPIQSEIYLSLFTDTSRLVFSKPFLTSAPGRGSPLA
ncbi:hypothetical protein HUU42_03030 [bacterium]|nr:hypothetical protein [bacterium]